MKTEQGHLTYCTNIHAGNNWTEDFAALKDNFPHIKKTVSPEQAMGLGLRLSNAASLELIEPEKLRHFKEWLAASEAYVFTMNGFPYGAFHHTVVKDDVHTPDWTTDERKNYTLRLFQILRQILPAGMDGGISTSPLSYRHWFKTEEKLQEARNKATRNMLEVIMTLIRINQETGQVLHLDIEPEPDGLLETGREFIDWFQNDLLPLGGPEIAETFGFSLRDAQNLIKKHLNLCYDVCHFAIGYEPHKKILQELDDLGIRVGKIQISAALKADLPELKSSRTALKHAFSRFNEPVYLHQVVARAAQGKLERYPDLPEALAELETTEAREWRAHFHVPISISEIGILSTTQNDILEVLSIQKEAPFTQHLEVETYTWEVLPEQIKIPIADSISKELLWVAHSLSQS